jgi:hypothetical protein
LQVQIGKNFLEWACGVLFILKLFNDHQQLSSTKDLLGRSGIDFLLFGMLAHNQEGNLCIEDLDGRVALDLSNGVSVMVFALLS